MASSSTIFFLPFAATRPGPFPDTTKAWEEFQTGVF
jgi:hypothetical protein